MKLGALDLVVFDKLIYQIKLFLCNTVFFLQYQILFFQICNLAHSLHSIILFLIYLVLQLLKLLVLFLINCHQVSILNFIFDSLLQFLIELFKKFMILGLQTWNMGQFLLLLLHLRVHVLELFFQVVVFFDNENLILL